jgi:hypothetical protein
VKVRLFLLVMSSTNLRDIVESKFYCTVNRARKRSGAIVKVNLAENGATVANRLGRLIPV